MINQFQNIYLQGNLKAVQKMTPQGLLFLFHKFARTLIGDKGQQFNGVV
jgi:hypothetical protein